MKAATLEKIIADAQAAGYVVVRHENCVDIKRMTKHAKPRVAVALRIWEDGTAIDGTLDLAAAKAIRTVKAMREFLGI